MEALWQVKEVRSFPKLPNPHRSWHLSQVLRDWIGLASNQSQLVSHEHLIQQNDATKLHNGT